MRPESQPRLLRVPRDASAAHSKAEDTVENLRRLAGAVFLDEYDGQKFLEERKHLGRNQAEEALRQEPGFGGDYYAELYIAATNAALRKAVLAGADVTYLSGEVMNLEIQIREKELQKKLERFQSFIDQKQHFGKANLSLLWKSIARAREAGVDVDAFEDWLNAIEKAAGDLAR